MINENKKKETTPQADYSFRDDSMTNVNLPVSSVKKIKSLSIQKEDVVRGDVNPDAKNENLFGVMSDNRLSEEPSMVFHESLQIRAN